MTEPEEWAERRVLTANEGTIVRLVGQAFHNRGIVVLTVAGEPARMRPRPDGVVDFDAVIQVPPTATTVVVELVPASGQPIARSLTLRGLPLGPAEAGPPLRRYSSGGAALQSLLIPGLGQVYTGRPLLGVFFLGASAGAAAFGVLSTETTVRCLAPLSGGVCPLGQEHSRVEDTPYLIPGLAAAGGLAVIAAVEAFVAARRHNARSGPSGMGATARAHPPITPALGVSARGLELGFRLHR